MAMPASDLWEPWEPWEPGLGAGRPGRPGSATTQRPKGPKARMMTLTATRSSRTLTLNGLTVTTTLRPTRPASCGPAPPGRPGPVLLGVAADLPDGSCFRRTLPSAVSTVSTVSSVCSSSALLPSRQPRPPACTPASPPGPGPLYGRCSSSSCSGSDGPAAPEASSRPVQYLGSFPVTGPDHASRADNVRVRLQELRANPSAKSVLLAISVAGIKVCSPDGQGVLMAHALRRVSYATCEPVHAQFSFLAREPRGQLSLQYCHSFLAASSQQAEELNSIVGNAFRMAYAAQLQRQDAALSKPANINNNNIFVSNNNANNNNNELRHTWAQQLISTRTTPPPAPPLPHGPHGHEPSLQGLPLRRPAAPATSGAGSTVLNPCSPESDDSNSPTELNSYRRLGDKPPLIKRLAMGLAGRESVEEDADVTPLVPDAAESPTNNNLVENSPISPPLGGPLTGLTGLPAPDNVSKLTEVNSRLSQCAHTGSMDLSDLKGKRISQISSCSSGLSSGPGAPVTAASNGQTVNANPSAPTPPPLPERTDSLCVRPEDVDLRTAPWFQAGIPREIALEVLGREPVGAFMVRESTTKLGCFALSLRVPRDFQPSGIAHYLILRTNKGYKIKGFTKEFSTLLALITHHSVMPELLPVPLALSRKHINSSRTDSSRDFADVDIDPDYNTLADFRKIMADLHV